MSALTGYQDPILSLPAAAVMPLRTPPTVRRDWSGFGLPESGLVMLTDTVLCTACPETEKACALGCSAAHDLPLPARAAAAQCLHCSNPPCLEVCPVGAIRTDSQGAVLIDQEVCIGCRFCEEVCPEGTLMFLDPALVQNPLPRTTGYTAARPNGRLPRTEAKCTLCTYRVEQGLLPVCAENCPHGAVYVGNLDRDTVTNGLHVGRLSDLLASRPYVVQELRPGVGSRLVHLR